ncbi:MAG: cell division protein ZapA [Leptospiraceae bacterium]|nr:cell division protein ZapA [Leptospiraceae bacterium]MCP5510283.1 cell division protein ZapA [Leptospiraceae bacterium]
MPFQTRIEATIFNNEYIITGDADPEYIRSITEYVDRKMKELSNVFPNTSPLKLAVLASVNITDELFQLRSQSSESQNTSIQIENAEIYEEKTRKLISLLDKGLSGEP